MEKLLKNVDYHFLVRILNDEVSQEEREYFESWLSELEKNREIFGEVTFLWDKIGSTQIPNPPDPNVQWERISQKVASIKKTKSFPQVKQESKSTLIQIEKFNESLRRRILSSNIIKAAAIITVLIIAGLLLFGIKQPTKRFPSQNIYQSKLYEAVTRKGEKITLTLADGSRVYVNSGSKVIYPNIFDSNTREIELTGEAFFSVVHDENKPFKVKSGNTITVVRGTEFNIRNRKNSVSIVVSKGFVDTYTPGSKKVYSLKQGDMVFYNNQTGITQQRKVDLNKYLAWRNDKLVFNRASLSDVMEEIERCFNVDVQFSNDSLRGKTLTGIFRTESIDRILSIISLTLDIKIVHDGRNIIVKSN